jgi:hypothetical protein
MFPQLRQRFGPALDLIVEFSTLGEYRLGADGVVYPASALAPASEHAPQLGGAGDSPVVAQAAVRRIVAGGAAGLAPAVTPAARRLGRDVAAAEVAADQRAPVCRGERRHARNEHAAPRPKPRPRVAAVGEQLCLAV